MSLPIRFGDRKKMVRVFGALVLMPFTVAVSAAQPAPTFADVFGPGMVLPHEVPLTFTGRAAPRQALELRVDGALYALRSDTEGRWRATARPLSAGGPYSISIKDVSGAGAELTDVLAGEVWLCSGQSNMEYPVVRSTDQPEDAMRGHPAIRLLTVAQQTALVPRDAFEKKPSWRVADAETIRRFSAVCYFFAQRKIAEEGLPIGLINASWGGSSIEPWMRDVQLARWPAYRTRVNLLRQYRTDARAAEVAFAGEWVKWWQSRSTWGPVWEKGVLDASADWQDAALRDWRTYPDPRLAKFTGNLWFSTRFDLTESQSRKGATFVLGKVDEVDTTWLNGRFVANTFGYGTRREYRLEKGMLQPGTNQFSVFVTSTWEAGGLYGPEADIGIRFDDGEFIPLGAGWKYRFVPKDIGYPPRAPWESVSGITGMFNGMIAPLQPLAPTGVIWYQGESNVDKGDYSVLLPGLIQDWRQWFRRELPFIVVQLPNYGAVQQPPAESQWASLRNIQQQVAIRDERVGLVVTQDLGDDSDIHPRPKYAVAQRALQVARALKGMGAKNGVVPHLVGGSESLMLEFSPPLAATDAQEKRVNGFALCGTQPGSCIAAAATRRGGRVEIDRAAMPTATRVRYCWSDGGVCELKSMGGLPVGSFELPLRPAREASP
jgi:sialate O-acetylesterase